MQNKWKDMQKRGWTLVDRVFVPPAGLAEKMEVDEKGGGEKKEVGEEGGGEKKEVNEKGDGGKKDVEEKVEEKRVAGLDLAGSFLRRDRPSILRIPLDWGTRDAHHRAAKSPTRI